jgi:hypothetical protein
VRRLRDALTAASTAVAVEIGAGAQGCRISRGSATGPDREGWPLAGDEQKNGEKSNFCHDDLNQITRFRR